MLLILPCKSVKEREAFHADVRDALWDPVIYLRQDMMCMPAKRVKS